MEFLFIVGEDIKCHNSFVKNSCQFYNNHTSWTSNFTHRFLSKRNNMSMKRISTNHFTHNTSNFETSQLPVNRIDKQASVYAGNVISLSHKKHPRHVRMWMISKYVLKSRRSQTQSSTYCMILFYMRFQNQWT